MVTTIFGERFTAATTSPGQIPSGKTLGHSTLAVRLALGSSHPKVSEFIYIYLYIYIRIYVLYIYIFGTEMDIHQSSTTFIHQAVVILSPDATGGEFLRHSQVNARMDMSSWQ